jgi:hypothetical protein
VSVTLKISRGQRVVVFTEKKMNKILQNVFFKKKKREEREKCIDEFG